MAERPGRPGAARGGSGRNGAAGRLSKRGSSAIWMSRTGPPTAATFSAPSTCRTVGAQIALVSVGNGAAQILKTFEWPGPGGLSLSPDGRYVAYDLGGDVFLLAVRGTHEAALVENPANDFNPIWAPDGNRILFTSDRTGSLRGSGFFRSSTGIRREHPSCSGPTWARRGPCASLAEAPTSTAFRPRCRTCTSPSSIRKRARSRPRPRRPAGGSSARTAGPSGRLTESCLAFVSRPAAGWAEPAAALHPVPRDRQAGGAAPADDDHLHGSAGRPMDARSWPAAGTREAAGGLYRIDAQTGDVSPVVQSGRRRASCGSLHGLPTEGRSTTTMGAGIMARDLGTGQERQVQLRHFQALRALAGRALPGGRPGRSRRRVLPSLEIVALDTGQSRELLGVPDARGVLQGARVERGWPLPVLLERRGALASRRRERRVGRSSALRWGPPAGCGFIPMGEESPSSPRSSERSCGRWSRFLPARGAGDRCPEVIQVDRTNRVTQEIEGGRYPRGRLLAPRNETDNRVLLPARVGGFPSDLP